MSMNVIRFSYLPKGIGWSAAINISLRFKLALRNGSATVWLCNGGHQQRLCACNKCTTLYRLCSKCQMRLTALRDLGGVVAHKLDHCILHPVQWRWLHYCPPASGVCRFQGKRRRHNYHWPSHVIFPPHPNPFCLPSCVICSFVRKFERVFVFYNKHGLHNGHRAADENSDDCTPPFLVSR
jgi:hypothetical protein